MTKRRRTDTRRISKAFDLAATVHSAKVANLLAGHGYDAEVVVAAILHDKAKDRHDFKTIKKEFGARVMSLVAEATDPEELENSAHHSSCGRSLVIAIKTVLLDDLLTASPKDPSRSKIIKEFRRAKEIVDNCRAADPALEKAFDVVYKRGQKKFKFK